ncbi:Syndecan-1 [Triplophysa tibetana]|uniref:Syndecan n=1 Tax=Triplophysa tibetana TaxID=1572043 RepID=A0A5A9NPP8_9TELE|nr:Syndecan-1 [Triplophysa tibetana]
MRVHHPSSPFSFREPLELNMVQGTHFLYSLLQKALRIRTHQEMMKPQDQDQDWQNMDADFHFLNEMKPREVEPDHGHETAAGFSSGNLLERKEVLAGVVAGGVVGLMFAVMLVALMIYRMKKKDEGSYALEEHRHDGYMKPQKQVEFLA